MPRRQPALLRRERRGLNTGSSGPEGGRTGPRARRRESGARSRDPAPDLRILITCEHAGNRVPALWRPLFRGHDELLASHRGWDPGALPLARHLARRVGGPLRYTTTTRLLVDPNRSPGHGTLFSELTRDLPEEERRGIVNRHHRPYWRRVLALLTSWLEEGAVALHIGVHTFTPVLDDVPREVDVGVLFDPERAAETGFARDFIRELEAALSHLRVRPNAPYHGTSDGLTTSLRRSLGDPRYLGIELEVSQGLTTGPESERRRVIRGVGDALVRTLSPGG